MEIKGVKVEFGEKFTYDEEEKIMMELKKCINFVFKTEDMSQVIALDKVIFRMNRLKSESEKIVNGIYKKYFRTIEINIEKDNIKKFRNTLCHELIHAKFSDVLFNENKQLFKADANDDFPMYLISEYNACKRGNEYSPISISELKEWMQIPFDKFYSNRSSNDKDKLKELSTLIVMNIVSSDSLFKLGYKEYALNIRILKELKTILEEINFIPTIGEYIKLKTILDREGFLWKEV